MKYVYMVNRFNLKETSGTVIRKLRDASRELNREYEILVNETPEDAKEAVWNLRGKECIITALGGDGTINLLLNDLAGTGNILSYLPVGTGNDFHRTCMETFDDGIHETDIVRINDRYFINAACFGIDADIANDDAFIHNHMIPKSMRYNAGVLYHFLTYNKGRKLKIECNDETIEKEFTTVVAANCRYYGSGYKISPGSEADDGCIELYMVDRLGKINMARTILSMKKAGHLKNPALRMIKTKKLTISSDHPISSNIDGEPLEADRFEIEVIPKGIRVEIDRDFIKRVAG